ncbi:dipeptidase [Halobacillus salinus]|uniref:Membrane dipeptidase n=1 Tax=Halobacillus salinus TaxID=192814 RepID=A0A4Z0H5E0_9BACI|nr:dipeptidase [Halobacillus salinus]TGB04456.1 membrane dipeptidase [Halobacillus salinus]
MYKWIDGHNDTILRVDSVEAFLDGNDQTHIDLPRAKEASLGAGFFAMFSQGLEGMPDFSEHKTDKGYKFPLPDPLPLERSQAITNRLLSKIIEVEKHSKGYFTRVKTTVELEECLTEERFGAIVHMEGAESVDRDLHSLDVYYEAGLRSLGLVWSRKNDFATGVPYHFPSTPDIGEGLSEAGKALVRKCNELGIMIDVSHLNEKGFWDVVELSEAPIVATHSNVHRLCQSSRNLTDNQIDAIGRSNGVIGVSYVVNMLREDGAMDADIPLTTITKHIHYIIDRIGVDHVALGSDFDGATVPESIRDVTGVPGLVDRLREEGLSEEDLKQVLYKNWIRVLEDTWKQ